VLNFRSFEVGLGQILETLSFGKSRTLQIIMNRESNDANREEVHIPCKSFITNAITNTKWQRLGLEQEHGGHQATDDRFAPLARQRQGVFELGLTLIISYLDCSLDIHELPWRTQRNILVVDIDINCVDIALQNPFSSQIFKFLFKDGNKDFIHFCLCADFC
jgi:hypothetical protein